MKKILTERMEELDINRYQIAKRIAENRGENKSPSNYTSLVTKTLEDPESRSHQTLKEIIECMGGQIVIRWTNYSESSIS